MDRRALGCTAVILMLITTSGCDFVQLIGNHVAGNKQATRTDSHSVPIPGSGRCEIETENGSIRCISGDVLEIEVEATLTARAASVEQAEEHLELMRVDRAEEGGVARIAAHVPSTVNGKVSLTVVVPAHLTLTLESSNGGIKTRDTSGPIHARTSNGKIDISGQDIQLVDAETSNGAIRVSGRLLPGDHRLETSNGSIKATLVQGPMSIAASTSNGRILVNGRKVRSNETVVLGGSDVDTTKRARLTAETSNGSIVITQQERPEATAEPSEQL